MLIRLLQLRGDTPTVFAVVTAATAHLDPIYILRKGPVEHSSVYYRVKGEMCAWSNGQQLRQGSQTVKSFAMW